MVALREYPIPETRLDSSVFEVSEEDEYRSVAGSFKYPITAATPVASHSGGFSSSSLLRLVRQRDYISAGHVRAEMIQHQLPITPDYAFILPAIHVVNSSADPAVKVKEFCGWLSLLPVADEETGRRPMFGRLINSLSNDPHPDVQLIMAFVRICVSKGYMVKIPDQMIPLVVRLAPPSVSLQFLDDLRSLVVKNLTPDKQMRRKIRFWCKTAMTEYLGIGLVEEAAKAFQMGLQYGSSLPRSPSRWLGKAVRKDPDHFGLSTDAVAQLTGPRTRPPRRKEPSPYAGLMPNIPSVLSPPGLDTDPSDTTTLLARMWVDAHSMKPPHALDVARFLETFDSRPTVVQFFSDCNQRKPARCRGQWVLGEMIYYARRKEWKELIGAFDTYFFRSGVPENIDEHKLRGRVTAPTVRQRLFPSPYHTALVWTACVEILQGNRHVSALFQELVKQVTTSKTREYAQVGPPPVLPSTKVFDAGHFNPFLVAAYRRRRYRRLAGAFGEMCRLGIEPQVEQLSLLAGAYAGMAEGHETIRTLSRIEGVLKKQGTNGSPRSPHHVSRDVALYMPALTKFMGRKDTAGASLVGRRILGCGYVKGTNPHIDRVLEKLEIPTAVAH